MKKHFGIVLLALGLCHVPVALAGEEDFLTMTCLLGLGNDENDENFNRILKLCSVISPDQTQNLIEAQRKNKERNRAALQELNAACESRLRQAYKDNETQIQIERKKTNEFYDANEKELLANPNRIKMIGCRIQAEDIGNQIIERRQIDEMFKKPAKPIDWPSMELVLGIAFGHGGSVKSELNSGAAVQEDISRRNAQAGINNTRNKQQSEVVAPIAATEGKRIYDMRCMACHSTGVAGAPKLGDNVAWAPRIAQGIDALHTHAITGVRGMMPRGTCASCSDDDLKNAVDYMVEQSQSNTLAGINNARIKQQSENALLTKVANDIKALESALNLYRLDNFNYPTTDQGLEALINKPEPVPPRWKKGGYADRLPMDPWQQPYQYRNPGKKGSIDIYSLGPDKASSLDDVGNWQIQTQ